MGGSILLYFVFAIIGFLLMLTILQLYSKHRTHHMKEIVFDVVPPSYWPTKKWQKSTPEAQGMNSDKLLEMATFYAQAQQKNVNLDIDSITVIRNEQVVADMYFNPLFPKGKKHIINSCTKSIMGLLIGIAIDKGYIESINVPVLEFFDDIKEVNKDERLKKLTLKNLLTMRTGWHSQDSYLYAWRGLYELFARDDWPVHILNLSFEEAPNTRFDYSNMASFMLSAIITKASGMNTLAFAEAHLFTPLGISDIHWDKNPDGIYMGFARMWLKPLDLAKIGLLCLQKGKWEGEKLLSETWIEDSIKAHSFPKQYRYLRKENNTIDFAASGGQWVFANLVRPFTDGYGYQWWLDESGMFSAIGVGGQFLILVPKERLIVVVTSKLKSKHAFFPVKLLKQFILPAIESNTALTSNPIAQEKLATFATAPILQRERKPIPDLPPRAKKVSGKAYTLNTSIKVNPWQYDRLMLEFEAGKDHAFFSYNIHKDQRIEFEIGLDNQYRISKSGKHAYAAIGAWASEHVFEIDYEQIGYSSKGKWILTYSTDQVEVQEVGMTGQHTFNGEMT